MPVYMTEKPVKYVIKRVPVQEELKPVGLREKLSRTFEAIGGKVKTGAGRAAEYAGEKYSEYKEEAGRKKMIYKEAYSKAEEKELRSKAMRDAKMKYKGGGGFGTAVNTGTGFNYLGGAISSGIRHGGGIASQTNYFGGRPGVGQKRYTTKYVKKGKYFKKVKTLVKGAQQVRRPIINAPVLNAPSYSLPNPNLNQLFGQQQPQQSMMRKKQKPFDIMKMY